MSVKKPQTVTCQICGKQKETLRGQTRRTSSANRSSRSYAGSYPDWSSEGYICIPDLNISGKRMSTTFLPGQRRITELEDQVVTKPERA